MLILLFWSAAVAYAAEVRITAVLNKGESGYAAFRIPGFLAFNDTLLAFAEGRKFGCGYVYLDFHLSAGQLVYT